MTASPVRNNTDKTRNTCDACKCKRTNKRSEALAEGHRCVHRHAAEASTYAGMRTDTDCKSERHRFDDNEISGFLETLARQKRECGLEDARHRLLAQPFREWYANLGSGGQSLSDRSVSALVVGMKETLAVRDALILSLVEGSSGTGCSTILEYAMHPHEPANVRYLYRLLDEAFNDRTIEPDTTWCMAGMSMLEEMTHRLPNGFGVQPLAVMSYVMWWMNLDEAAVCARKALAIDEECTLARIVALAQVKGLRPAWCL